MTTYILDSSAALRYIDDEAGAARVEELLNDCVSWRADLCISAVQWGEIVGRIRKRLGPVEEMHVLNSLLPSEVQIVPATAERAVRAAALKVDRNVAYADGFALGLAMEAADRVLVTADYGFKAVVDLAKIEFLPAKDA
jgi:PIN domain nuclease of toxin-antitoxin system